MHRSTTEMRLSEMGMTVEDESIAVIPVEETQCFMRIFAPLRIFCQRPQQ